ncbi:MAG: LacI family DNA-binding transcriptional regulator [Clostridia bacterium]|nr:LacI family DNA-binding transcriptional regulator [Clostridia bacterium]
MATIKEVALRSGVSISTVSIILNGKEKERRIPESTVQRVHEAMRELDYHPNRAARKLRGVVTRPVIALFWVLDKRSTFFMRLVRGIEEALNHSDCPCELVIHPYTNGELANEERFLLSADYQGVLIGALSKEDEAYLETLSFQVPVMVLNRVSGVFPYCTTSTENIGAMAARFAMESGCKRIAVATDEAAVVPKTTRRDSVIAACAQAGIPCSAQHYIEVENSLSGGVEAARRLMRAQRPDMVYLDNDIMALGFSLGCYAMQITDVSILCVCLNHPELGSHISPAITMIDIPGEVLGRRAAGQMSQLLYHKRESLENIICPCTFIRE